MRFGALTRALTVAGRLLRSPTTGALSVKEGALVV